MQGIFHSENFFGSMDNLRNCITFFLHYWSVRSDSYWFEVFEIVSQLILWEKNHTFSYWGSSFVKSLCLGRNGQLTIYLNLDDVFVNGLIGCQMCVWCDSDYADDGVTMWACACTMWQSVSKSVRCMHVCVYDCMCDSVSAYVWCDSELVRSMALFSIYYLSQCDIDSFEKWENLR